MPVQMRGLRMALEKNGQISAFNTVFVDRLLSVPPTWTRCMYVNDVSDVTAPYIFAKTQVNQYQCTGT